MKSPRMTDRARVTEIFSSLQGEGLRMGERHLFIRFEACQLECSYCDEKLKRGKTMSLAAVLRAVDVLENTSGPHAYVCFTGGEPLLYGAFLKPLCRALRKRGYRILLETNGVLSHALQGIRGQCDLIAMDVKLASVGGGEDLLKEHTEFLKGVGGAETYIKMVVSPGIDRLEYLSHMRMIASLAPNVPVFLQPVGQRDGGLPGPQLLKLLRHLQRVGQIMHRDVRLGIQLHKLLNIR